MLRMSRLADYSTVVMAHLARHPDRVFSASEVAHETRVALPTVSKIFKILAKGDLLVSRRGAKGGYLLARQPSEITLAHIIDALEGPVGLTECSTSDGACAQESSCSIRGNWQTINRTVRRALETVTLAQLIEPPAVPIEIITTRRVAAPHC